MNNSHMIGAFCAVLFSLITAATQAALIGVLPATPGGTDYQAYQDDVTGLIWLANADINGSMTSAEANAWVTSLNINGVTGWRLPKTEQPDPGCGDQFYPGDGSGIYGSGYFCTGSEMGNLFHNVLGGHPGESIEMTHNANYELVPQYPKLFISFGNCV